MTVSRSKRSPQPFGQVIIVTEVIVTYEIKDGRRGAIWGIFTPAAFKRSLELSGMPVPSPFPKSGRVKDNDNWTLEFDTLPYTTKPEKFE